MSFLTLAFNPDDIVRVLRSIQDELIILAVAAVIALAVIIAISVLKVQKPLKKLVRGTSWVALLLAVIIVANMIVSGPLYGIVNNALRSTTTANPTATDPTGETGGEGEAPASSLTEEVIAEATELCEDLAAEGTVLLKNDGILPLADDVKLNTFGWSATNPVYGGTGSGALSQQYPIVSFLDGLTNAGIEYNTALTNWYTEWRADRPYMMMEFCDWTIPEPTQAEYEAAGMYESALAYSDTAVFFIARSGGEGQDLPTTYSELAADTDISGWSTLTLGHSVYEDDLDPNKHYLELSNRERATLERLNQDYENIIVIVNAANAMELGFIEEYEHIRAAVLVPGGPGQSGFNSLGKLLSGELNFSGKTVDTYLYDLTTAPTWNNFGHFQYDNMSEFTSESQTTVPTFVNYVENIYVGYRFWETAADEELLDYDEYVLYPFGYGLSYTTFTQELVSVTENGGVITATVTVTNTGNVAGKDIVQMYYDPPYTNGGVEKATANLIAFDKTKELAPNESETLTLTWNVEDMASYDDTYNGTGAWVVEAGAYIISLNANSHDIIDEETLNLSQVVDRESDAEAAVNQLQWAENSTEITYLSRKDGFANYDKATAAPSNFSMSDSYKAGFYNHVNYDPSLQAARTACHNILYVTANSRAYASDVDLSTPTWQIVVWTVSAVLALALAAVEVVLVKNYRKRVAEAKTA